MNTLTLPLFSIENRQHNKRISPGESLCVGRDTVGRTFVFILNDERQEDHKGSKPVMEEKVEHKINLVEDADAAGEVAKVYDEWRAQSGRQQMPGILKCFSHRPDFLRQVMAFSNGVHFF
jgi:hypothetical protein